MHASSLENMQECYRRYVCGSYLEGRKEIQVVDIGGANVNGSYADIFSPPLFTYIAADLDEKDNVDVVLNDPYKLPFPDSSVDMVISGQVLEHVECFWLLFEEMGRVVKEDGYIFLIAPSAGPIHKYPVDCYRFYPDAYKALAKYAKLHLIDSWLDDRGPWNDLVGIFSRKLKERIVFAADLGDDTVIPKNRYEISTMPTILEENHEDESFEITQGEVSYLHVLNKLHLSIQPGLYFEVGIRKGRSLELARCDSIAVDPLPELTFELPSNISVFKMTSDDFFAREGEKIFQSKLIDLAFIDGMHLFEFVLRDFINVEKYCSSESIIVIDDICPNHPLQASRERETRVWTGDVWKFAICLEKYRPDLQLTFLNTHPTGLLIIQGLNPKNKQLTKKYNYIVRQFKGLGFDESTASRFIDRLGSKSPFEFLHSLE